MSEFGSESDDYTYASPSPGTRRNGPFLDATINLSDDADSERSSDQEGRALSQSTQSDDPSGDPIPTTSTPDLSFAASSSPLLFSTTLSPSSHTTNRGRLQCGNAASLSKLTSDHTSFVRRLDYLLQQAADQQRLSIPSDNIRIQPYSPEGLSGPESQMVSIGHDEGLELALGQRGYCCRFSPLPSQEFPRSSSLISGTSEDNTLATVVSDTGIDPRRNKRKAKAAIHEDSEAPSTSFSHDGNPSDSYLSASDGAPPAASRGCHQPWKKRKCLSLDLQPSLVPPCAGSPALSDPNLERSKSSPVQSQQDFGSNTIYDATEGPADVTLSHSFTPSTAGSVLSYPPTEPVTPVPGYSLVPSPVPVLGPQAFLQVDIPRVFLSSDDAAEARLMSLLRKETLHWRGEEQGAFLTQKFTSPNTLVKESIAWILTVEPPLGSPTASSIRGRAHSYDLHEQLTVHHNTRFLAALIFSLFLFFPARGDSETLLKPGQSETGLFREPEVDEDKAIWDYAVAAIALAVKMHRDSHAPLKPIFGNHFLALACHEMSFEDLEWAQRHLLLYFSYNLCIPTPQAFIEELPLALPTLRDTLESEHEREDVLSETWKQLIAAARWPSMLRFPVSLLTATALIEAIKRVTRRRLSFKKLNGPAESLKSTSDCPMKHATLGMAPRDSILERESSDIELDVQHTTSAVSEDIRKVLGLSTEKIDECEKWLELVRSALEKPFRSKYFPGVS